MELDSRIIDRSGGKLSDLHLQALTRMLENNDSILQIIALPNITEITDAAENPRGIIVAVPRESNLDPSLLPQRLLSVMSVYTIKNSAQLKESDLEKLKDVMPQIMEEHMGTGPSLDCFILSHIDPQQNGRDKKSWKPSLGSAGFISLARAGTSRFDTTLALAIYSTNERMSKQLFEAADDMCEKAGTSDHFPTFGDFMKSTEYTAARNAQKRNNDRLAMAVATSMSMELEKTAEDKESLQLDATVPVKARADTMTFYDHLAHATFTVKEGNGVETQSATVIYSKAGSITSSVGGCAMPVDPLRGYILFKGTYSQQSISMNDVASALLCGVGHASGPGNLSQKQQDYIAGCVHFEGKSGTQVHTKALRNYHDDREATDMIMADNDGVTVYKFEHVSCFQAGQ